MIEEFKEILEEGLKNLQKVSGETDIQFKGFKLYCEKRFNSDKSFSMSDIAEELDVAIKTVYNWSSKNEWKIRYRKFYDTTLYEFMDTVGRDLMYSNTLTFTNIMKLQIHLGKTYDLIDLFKLYSQSEDFDINKFLYIYKELSNITKMNYKLMFGNKFEEIGVLGVNEELYNKTQETTNSLANIDEIENMKKALKPINEDVKDIETIIKEQKEKEEQKKKNKEEE